MLFREEHIEGWCGGRLMTVSFSTSTLPPSVESLWRQPPPPLAEGRNCGLICLVRDYKVIEVYGGRGESVGGM